MPFGFSRTIINIGLEYLTIGVILFQKSALVVELYLIYPKFIFSRQL